MNVNIGKIQTIAIDRIQQRHRNLILEINSSILNLASQLKLTGAEKENNLNFEPHIIFVNRLQTN